MNFTIKETILKNGTKIYTPLAKQETKPYFLNLYNNQWQRIIKIYGRYMLLDIFEDNENFGLTIEDCCDHINGYIEYVKQMKGNEVESINYHDASNFEANEEMSVGAFGTITPKYVLKSFL